jgi:glycosyltransferase involved in cell wall biosynthesis
VAAGRTAGALGEAAAFLDLGSRLVRVAPAARRPGPARMSANPLRTALDHPRVHAALWDVLWRRRREYDILHAFAPNWFSWHALLIARLLGKRVVVEVTLEGQDDPLTVRGRGMRNAAKRLMYTAAHVVTNISPALAERCRAAGMPGRKVWMIPRPVDTARFAPATVSERARLRTELELPTARPIVLFVGELTRRKGADLLPEVVQALEARGLATALVVVGRSTGDAESRAIVTDLEVLGRSPKRTIRIASPTARIERYMRAADVFLFPSRREGFGTVVPEAMACGVPVVARRLPGITDYVVTDGRDGILVQADSAVAFADAVGGLLVDQGRRAQIAELAVATVQAKFADTVIDARYAELYRALTTPAGVAHDAAGADPR